MRTSSLYCTLFAIALAALAPTSARAQSQPALPELLSAGDQAWSARNYGEALRRYGEVLRQDSTSSRALYRVATLLAWRNDLDRSIDLFRKYLTLAPQDADGRVALARTLAWRGGYGEALGLCDGVLADNPENRDAALLEGQIMAWSGRLAAAAAAYDRWLARHPNDAEAWNGLAQVWRWSGRPAQARDALRRASAAEPGNADALAQLQWIETELAPSLEPAITSTDDTDKNQTLTYVMRAGFAAPWGARLQADASYRDAELGAARGASTSLRASSAWGSLDGHWRLDGVLGAAYLEGTDGANAQRSHTEPIASAHLLARLAPRFTLGGSVTRGAFDETAALILNGIASTSIAGDADMTLRPRLTLGGDGGWTRLTGGISPNSRVSGSGSLRWSATPAISLAAGVRAFGYGHPAADGYFTPKRYLLAEASTRTRFGAQLGWGFDGELGLGYQRITAFDDSNAGRFAQRCSAGVLYRPNAGVEWGAAASFANVASPTTTSSADYRAFGISFKGRIRI